MKKVPNILSAFRLLLVPVFAVVFFSSIAGAYILAACVYILALITDILDGYIARHFDAVSRLGRILDPLADKLMGAAVLACMAIAHILPVWSVLVFVGKELLMLAGSVIMLRQESDVMSANYVGKAATFLLCAVCVALLVFGGISAVAANLMIGAALSVSLVSLGIYAADFLKRGTKKAS